MTKEENAEREIAEAFVDDLRRFKPLAPSAALETHIFGPRLTLIQRFPLWAAALLCIALSLLVSRLPGSSAAPASVEIDGSLIGSGQDRDWLNTCVARNRLMEKIDHG